VIDGYIRMGVPLSEQLAYRKRERALEKVTNKVEDRKKQQADRATAKYQAYLSNLELSAFTLKSFSPRRLAKILEKGSKAQRSLVEVFQYLTTNGLKHYFYPKKTQNDEKCLDYFHKAVRSGYIKTEPCRVCLFCKKEDAPDGKPYHPDSFFPYSFTWMCPSHLTAMKRLRIKPVANPASIDRL